MAADTGNSEPLCSLWWLMDVRCYMIALLTQWIILSKINSKVQILKTNLNTYTTCQHTHTEKKKTYPQHILQTHRKHIQNIKSKQKHIQTIYSCSIFDMLYKYFFPCTHHKRNIFHFLIVAFPLGGPPARTSGRQNHWDTPGFQVRLGSTSSQREMQRLEDFDPTGEAPGRASGRQSHWDTISQVPS